MSVWACVPWIVSLRWVKWVVEESKDVRLDVGGGRSTSSSLRNGQRNSATARVTGQKRRDARPDGGTLWERARSGMVDRGEEMKGGVIGGAVQE